MFTQMQFLLTRLRENLITRQFVGPIALKSVDVDLVMVYDLYSELRVSGDRASEEKLRQKPLT